MGHRINKGETITKRKVDKIYNIGDLVDYKGKIYKITWWDSIVRLNQSDGSLYVTWKYTLKIGNVLSVADQEDLTPMFTI